MQYWIQCLKKYAVFSGRARRREYWLFALFNVIFMFLGDFFVAMLAPEYSNMYQIVWNLVTGVPSLAVFVRRMHDIGKSGWWFLFAFIPVVGAIVLLIFLCKDSQPESNVYGENPKLI